MGAFDGLLVTLAGLSPSIGVFIVGSDVIRTAGSGAVLCFGAAVVLGIAMASIYAELGSAMPTAGGEYTIAGRVLGPAYGFAMLSINLCGLCLAMSLSGLGTAGYLRAVVPGLPLLPTALALVIIVTLLAVLSIRTNAAVTGLLLACELASLGVVAWLGFAHAQPGGFSRLVHPVMAAGGGGVRAVPWAVLGLGAAGGIYAFNGYGSIIFFGEEVRDARRTVARVVYGSLAIAAVIELVPMAGVVVGAPDMASLSVAGAPVQMFMAGAGGPVLARVISLAVAAAIFNAMIAIVLSAGRQLFASARDGAWPDAGGRWLTRVHPRFGSPHIATLAVGAAGLACCFLPERVLITVLANGNIATYATLCLASIVGRRRGTTAGTLAPAPLFPLGPIVVLLALAGVVWADLQDVQTGVPGLLSMLAIVALGVLIVEGARAAFVKVFCFFSSEKKTLLRERSREPLLIEAASSADDRGAEPRPEAVDGALAGAAAAGVRVGEVAGVGGGERRQGGGADTDEAEGGAVRLAGEQGAGRFEQRVGQGGGGGQALRAGAAGETGGLEFQDHAGGGDSPARAAAGQGVRPGATDGVRGRRFG